MQQQGVILRIKRRRDYQAPDEIVLEATSRTSALLTDFQRSLGITSSIDVQAEATDTIGPPKKRCRFVLLKPTAAQGAAQDHHHQQQQALHSGLPHTAAAAAASAEQAPQHPSPAAAAPGARVLDLWHSSGVSYPPNSKGTGGRTPHSQDAGIQQQHTSGHPSSADTAAVAGAATSQPAGSSTACEFEKGIMYEHMVHDYLQQQQQQAPAAAPSVEAHKPPSKRAARAHSYTAAAAAEVPYIEPPQQQQQQQQQQESTQLPEYMTKEMLQQYGLSTQAHQVLPPAAAAAAAAAGCTSSTSAVEGSDEPEYVYDMYAPAYEEQQLTAGEGPFEQQQQRQGDDPAALTIVQLWEEDLAGFDDLWSLPAGAATAAAGDDSEDSNAEDYHANDYPDEEESNHSMDEDDSDFSAEHHTSDELVADQAGDGHDSLITCYKPQLRPSARHAGVIDDIGSEEFDVDEYESSGDEEQLQGWYNSGAAWRAVLAKECGILQQDDACLADAT